MVAILLTILVAMILFAAFYVAILAIKKKDITSRSIICFAIDSLISLVVSYVIYFISKALLNPMDTSSLIKFAAVIYILFIFISSSNIVLDIKNKNFKLNKRKLIVQIGTFMIILLELFAFNSNAYKDDYKYYEIQDITTLQTSSNAIKQENGTIYLPDNSYIIIDKVVENAQNIYFDFNKINLDSYIQIYYKTKDQTDYTFYREFQYDRFNILTISDITYDSLRIQFYQDGTHDVFGNLYLKGISFNKPMALVFHLSRIIVLTALLVSFVYISVFVRKMKFKEDNKFTYLKRGILITFGVVLVVFIHLRVNSKIMIFICKTSMLLKKENHSLILYRMLDLLNLQILMIQIVEMVYLVYGIMLTLMENIIVIMVFHH